MIDYASELNKSQLKAVEFMEGPALIIAGAGSGKTRVLVYRVARLVEKDIPPESVLLLTFTRRASVEMMKRASAILDARCSKVAGGTFHSFANMILRRYAKEVGFNNNYTILDQDDSSSIIHLLRAQLGYDRTIERFPKKKTIKDILSKLVNTGYSIKKVLFKDYPHFVHFEDEFRTIQEGYAKYKKEKNLLDYDDLLVFLKQLLADDDQVRRTVSNHYRYIMVDEYQDTNKLQGHIAALLASEHENIVVVGDDAQSIYSFRGANFRNIMDFPDIFPQAEIITLEQNYRSVQPILNLTNSIIENAKEKYSKVLFTDMGGVQKPVFVSVHDEDEQAEFVCDRVLQLREEGVHLQDIAVLFRNGFHSNQLEVELGNRNIPYVKYGGIKFLEAAHVKDVVSFLKTVLNIHDEIAWRRVLLLIEGIGEVAATNIIGKVSEFGFKGLSDPKSKDKKYGKDLWKLKDVYQNIDPDRIPVEEMIQIFIPFYKPLMEKKYDNYTIRFEDIKSLATIASNYPSLESFLSQVTLDPPERSIVKAADKDDENLILSTIHSAKGLEWHTVFIISLLEGFLPDQRSMGSEEEIEEERRLFYVAATRAKENLFLMKPSVIEGGYRFSTQGNFSGMLKLSRFIREIENFPDLVEVQTYERGYIQQNFSSLGDHDAGSGSEGTMRRIQDYFE